MIERFSDGKDFSYTVEPNLYPISNDYEISNKTMEIRLKFHKSVENQKAYVIVAK